MSRHLLLKWIDWMNSSVKSTCCTLSSCYIGKHPNRLDISPETTTKKQPHWTNQRIELNSFNKHLSRFWSFADRQAIDDRRKAKEDKNLLTVFMTSREWTQRRRRKKPDAIRCAFFRELDSVLVWSLLKLKMLLRCQRRMTIAFCCLWVNDDNRWKERSNSSRDGLKRWKTTMMEKSKNVNIWQFPSIEKPRKMFMRLFIIDEVERMKRFICHLIILHHRLIKIPFQRNDLRPSISLSTHSLVIHIVHILRHLFFNYYATGFVAQMRLDWKTHHHHLRSVKLFHFVYCWPGLLFVRIYNYLRKFLFRSHWHLRYFFSPCLCPA